MRAELPETAVMTQRLSPERLRPYAIAVGGDLAASLDLYSWNTEISAALAATIGHVEVILRNAIHESLTVWSAREFSEPKWYLDAGHLLQARAIDDIRVAQRRAVRDRRHNETPGRVVAELSLGFWKYLLANHYDATLWRQALHEAFPGQERRRVIKDAIEVLHLSRNRIAHHEPMFNRPLADIQFTALELAGWICPVSRAWIERRCSVSSVLARRP
ncbi:Abi family protein [Actinoplanes bogorensis]|uniref:Abi family protein n=1 Tax=Paractinoplanes bogorensis TaxID=1610840 RepID=A0ABS5Z4C5_9ACTN|nr:Abi family protein [Actinoplanes bogorensis]MBU2669813.1 Abi family protein [Actinoplanes bogorensis]